jgi:hypothetical protein
VKPQWKSLHGWATAGSAVPGNYNNIGNNNRFNANLGNNYNNDGRYGNDSKKFSGHLHFHEDLSPSLRADFQLRQSPSGIPECQARKIKEALCHRVRAEPPEQPLQAAMGIDDPYLRTKAAHRFHRPRPKDAHD